MSGYTPIFNSIFRGTLCGRWPDTGVWLCLLALADKDGRIDSTIPYISAVTGVPVDVLTECIKRFMAPDPLSRTQTDDGRRLSLIDPERPWGWIVVNHGKYREKARKAAYDSVRTASGADAERKRRERQKSGDVPTCPDVSREVPLSNTNTNKDSRRAASGEPELSDSLDKALFAEARKVFGNSIGGQINRAIRAKGKPWVLAMIEQCRNKDPEAARAYLAKSLEPKRRGVVV